MEREKRILGEIDRCIERQISEMNVRQSILLAILQINLRPRGPGLLLAILTDMHNICKYSQLPLQLHVLALSIRANCVSYILLDTIELLIELKR